MQLKPCQMLMTSATIMQKLLAFFISVIVGGKNIC